MMLDFENREEALETLLLFWRVAKRLQQVTDQLPEPSVRGRLRVERGRVHDTLARTIESGERSVMELHFPTLPDEVFEVLALRFRPFFAQNERTYFMNILSLLDRKNPHLRGQTKDLREQWRRAVFWGRMGMTAADTKVKTDDIINVGFYSKYFHVAADKLKLADEYRRKMGSDIFDLALISSVWERACLVVYLARGLQEPLLQLGVLTQVEIDKLPGKFSGVVTLELAGGPGAIQVHEPGTLDHML